MSNPRKSTLTRPTPDLVDWETEQLQRRVLHDITQAVNESTFYLDRQNTSHVADSTQPENVAAVPVYYYISSFTSHGIKANRIIQRTPPPNTVPSVIASSPSTLSSPNSVESPQIQAGRPPLFRSQSHQPVQQRQTRHQQRQTRRLEHRLHLDVTSDDSPSQSPTLALRPFPDIFDSPPQRGRGRSHPR